MAKITAPMMGFLSNSEVLRVLQDRGAGAQAEPGARALPSERLAYHYLAEHSPGVRSRDELQTFVDALKPYGLSKAEVLNLLNTCPTSPVEVHLIVHDCEARLGDDKVQQVLDLVAMHLKH